MSGAEKQSPREIPERLRKQIILNQSVVPFVMLVLAWIVYLVAAVWKFDIIGYLHNSFRNDKFDANTPFEYLCLASIGTIGCAIYVLLAIHKALGLARYGVEIQGEIVKLGALSIHRFGHVYCHYSYNGNSYSVVWSEHVDEAATLSVGDSVALIVDPKNPKRYMRKSEIYGYASSSSATKNES
jgi:hypothetical protein